MKLLVYGAGDFGRLARELLRQCGHEFAGFIDDWNPAAAGVLGAFDAVRDRHAPGTHGVVLAVGYRDLAARWEVYEKVKRAGYVMPPLIHPAAYVYGGNGIGEATIVMTRAIVDQAARIAECCVLWPGANVSHDSSIGRNCFLSPNCAVCGFASVGDHCFLGAGSVVVDHREVPPHTRIKAGQVFS